MVLGAKLRHLTRNRGATPNPNPASHTNTTVRGAKRAGGVGGWNPKRNVSGAGKLKIRLQRQTQCCGSRRSLLLRHNGLQFAVPTFQHGRDADLYISVQISQHRQTVWTAWKPPRALVQVQNPSAEGRWAENETGLRAGVLPQSPSSKTGGEGRWK